MLEHLFSLTGLSAQSETTEGNEGRQTQAMFETTETRDEPIKVPELAEHMENMYVKLAHSALKVLKEIRSGSSTVNVFSLPPLQKNELDEVWKTTPIVEQTAK